MAGNNSIQFLRGTAAQRATHSESSLQGQPIFETDTNKLYVGDGTTSVKNLDAINATNADHATTADSATNADHATTADSATNANHAYTADNASLANSVGCELNFMSYYGHKTNSFTSYHTYRTYDGSIKDSISSIAIYAPFYYPDADAVGSSFGCWGVRNNIVGWYYPSKMTVTDNNDGTVNIIYDSNTRLMP